MQRPRIRTTTIGRAERLRWAVMLRREKRGVISHRSHKAHVYAHRGNLIKVTYQPGNAATWRVIGAAEYLTYLRSGRWTWSSHGSDSATGSIARLAISYRGPDQWLVRTLARETATVLAEQSVDYFLREDDRRQKMADEAGPRETHFRKLCRDYRREHPRPKRTKRAA